MGKVKNLSIFELTVYLIRFTDYSSIELRGTSPSTSSTQKSGVQQTSVSYRSWKVTETQTRAETCQLVNPAATVCSDDRLNPSCLVFP